MTKLVPKTISLLTLIAVLSTAAICMSNRAADTLQSPASFQNYVLGYDAPLEATLQSKLESIDSDLRAKYGMTPEQTAVGVLDLRRMHLAMLHPDREEYAASVAKLGILLAYF